MNVKCNNCGAFQSLDSGTICNYCGNSLPQNPNNDNLIKDFILIKYEYNQKNYKQVLKLSNEYLSSDSTSIPCWAYKITSEFIYGNYDFLELTNGLKIFSDLVGFNNTSKKVIEEFLRTAISDYAQNSILLLKSFYKDNQHGVHQFIAFAFYNFSKEFNEFLNDIFISELNSLNLDPLFNEATELIFQSGMASTSLLQRRLKLGYNRAGLLIDQLTAVGVIGPSKGSKVYEILIKSEFELDQKLKKIGLDRKVSNQPIISKSKSGCFIATATLGDYDHPVVMDLRYFRDNWLLTKTYGISFVNWYYKNGPYVSRLIEKSIVLKKITYYLIILPLHLIIKIFFR